MRSMMWSVVADGHHHRRGHAALPGAAGHRRDDVRSTVISGSASGMHDEVVLRAAEGEDALEVGGAAAVDDLRDVRRADEGDRLDAGVVADRLDGLLPAVHDVEHAVGQPRLAQQLGDAAGAQRHLLGRLEDHAVAERDRVGDGPVRHHVREVERRDRRHDADRIALDAALDAAAHLQHFAGSDLRQRAGELASARRTSALPPRASLRILPFSSVTSAASSSMFFSSSAL